MRNFVLVVLTVLFMAGATAAESDYEVIKVGGEEGIHGAGVFRWSPDGTKLGFFQETTFCYSDTLGNVTKVGEILYNWFKFEWVDNESIVIYNVDRAGNFREFRKGKPEHGLIQHLKLDSTITTIAEETITYPEDKTLNFLQKGYNGTLYLCKGGLMARDGFTILPLYDSPEKMTKAENDFVLGVNEQGIFKINLANGDSTLIMTNTKGYTKYQPYIRPLMNYNQDLLLLDRGSLVLLNLKDSSEVILDELIGKEQGVNVFCDFARFSFCGTGNTIVFHRRCDDGHYITGGGIYSYDYEAKRYTHYWSFTGEDYGGGPEISSDCRHLAFGSGSMGLCIFHLGVGDE